MMIIVGVTRSREEDNPVVSAIVDRVFNVNLD